MSRREEFFVSPGFGVLSRVGGWLFRAAYPGPAKDDRSSR